MKYRNGIVVLAILMLSVTLTICIQFGTEKASAQQKDKEVKFQQKAIRPSSRIKAVIKGSEKPDQIPDIVAYELFIRTVAEGNARGLVKQAGLNDEEIESIVGDAYSVNAVLEGTDRRAFDLRSSKGILPDSFIKNELLRAQQKREEVVQRAITTWLQSGLGPVSTKKLRDFIKSQVKKNISKVLTIDSDKTQQVGFDKLSAHSFAPQGLSGGGELYLYSPTWHDGFGVYGSGSLSEQYTTNTSYRATVTVTSPTGRSNTTGSDWNYAAIVHDTGLSIGDEDGTYITEASFEEQQGYYDEYGNFYGTGSFFVGSSANGTDVPPLITLVSVVFLPPTVPPTQGTVSNAVAFVSYSRSVPANTTLEMELNDGISGGNPLYEINTPTFDPGGGAVIPGSSNREVLLTVPPAGDNPRSVRVTFPFRLSQNTGVGTVNANVRLGAVTVPSPQPSPPVTINPPPGGVNATLTIAAPSPTPTPTPSPTPAPTSTPVAGGPGCNPSTLLLGWCYAGGGDYIYPNPPCGCTVAIEKSPILIDTSGDGFAMTDAVNGVPFDLLGFGFPMQLSWTAANSDDAWLALDRNQNNRIDNGKELFGNATQQPEPPAGEERQGFLALARYDKAQNGGNGDGKITRADAVFKKLRLWIDRNHNGVSEPEEMYRLPALDVVSIRLDYQASNRVDEFGNRFKYRARVRDRANANVGRWAWDVFLNSAP